MDNAWSTLVNIRTNVAARFAHQEVFPPTYGDTRKLF
jgi:hypothetical protein